MYITFEVLTNAPKQHAEGENVRYMYVRKLCVRVEAKITIYYTRYYNNKFHGVHMRRWWRHMTTDMDNIICVRRAYLYTRIS